MKMEIHIKVHIQIELIWGITRLEQEALQTHALDQVKYKYKYKWKYRLWSKQLLQLISLPKPPTIDKKCYKHPLYPSPSLEYSWNK